MAALGTPAVNNYDGVFDSRGELDRLTRGMQFNGSPLDRQQEIQSYAFGAPNNTKYRTEFDRWHPTYSLREAYGDQLVFLGTFVTGLTYYDNNEYMLQEPHGLPLVITEEQNWRWDEIIFDLPYVDVVPHEGPYRHVRARKQSGMATTQRRGLGIDIEHDWFMHPAGRTHFYRHVQQTKNGFLYTMVMCAFSQLIKARSAHVQYLRDIGALKVNNVFELHMQKAQNAFPFIKSAQGTVRELNEVETALIARGSALETIHLEAHAGIYFQGAGKENQQYMYAGERSSNWFYYNPSKSDSIPGRGYTVKYAKFPVEIARINPLRRTRVHGEYYTMFGLPLNRVDYATYKSTDRSISIYNYDMDSWHNIDLEDAIKESMAFDQLGNLLRSARMIEPGVQDPVGSLFAHTAGAGEQPCLGDLFEHVFPPKLCIAVARSIQAKGDAARLNAAQVVVNMSLIADANAAILAAGAALPAGVAVPAAGVVGGVRAAIARLAGGQQQAVAQQQAIQFAAQRPQGGFDPRGAIRGDMKQHLSSDDHYYGIMVSESPQSTPTQTTQETLNATQMHEANTTVFAGSQNLEHYNNIFSKLPTPSSKEKFVSKIYSAPKEQIGATLANIATISRTTQKQTAADLIAAIDNIPDAEVTSASATSSSSSSALPQSENTIGLYRGDEIKSTDAGFIPINCVTGEVMHHNANKMREGTTMHTIASMSHNIGVPLFTRLPAAVDGNAAVQASNMGRMVNDIRAHGENELTALAIVIAHIRITQQNLLALVYNDILYPLGHLIMRALISTISATALMGRFGRAVGFSPMSTVDAMFGDDVDVKRHTVNYSAYMTSIVYSSDPYFVRDDLFPIAQRGGFGVKWFKPADVQGMVAYRFDPVKRDMSRPSIFPLFTTYNVQTIRPCIDIRGRLTSIPGAAAAVPEDVDFITHYPASIATLVGGPNNVTPDPYSNGTAYNSVVFVGTHRTYNPYTKLHNRIVRGKGYFGENIYPGCRVVLDKGGVLEDQGYAALEVPF